MLKYDFDGKDFHITEIKEATEQEKFNAQLLLELASLKARQSSESEASNNA